MRRTDRTHPHLAPRFVRRREGACRARPGGEPPQAWSFGSMERPSGARLQPVRLPVAGMRQALVSRALPRLRDHDSAAARAASARRKAHAHSNCTKFFIVVDSLKVAAFPAPPCWRCTGLTLRAAIERHGNHSYWPRLVLNRCFPVERRIARPNSFAIASTPIEQWQLIRTGRGAPQCIGYCSPGRGGSRLRLSRIAMPRNRIYVGVRRSDRGDPKHCAAAPAFPPGTGTIHRMAEGKLWFGSSPACGLPAGPRRRPPRVAASAHATQRSASPKIGAEPSARRCIKWAGSMHHASNPGIQAVATATSTA